MENSQPDAAVQYPLPGPGILIALSSSGWIGLLSLITFGADEGYTFLGIIVITLLFKYALLTGLGRYTLATGKDIFYGIAETAGPKNWAIWMLNAVYYLEIFMLGYSSLTMARLCNELLHVRIPPIISVFIFFAAIFLLVSYNSYWLFRKILIGAISVILVGLISMLLSMPLPSHEVIFLKILDLSTFMSVYESSIILSSVGSGFSLLFYSVWLVNHMGGRVITGNKQRILGRIKLDAALGMSSLLFLCVLYLSVGYVFLYEHGLGAPESDLTFEIVLMVMNLGIFGNCIFVLVCFVALFCSMFGGVYGRSRVLQVTLPRTIPGFVMTRTTYLAITLVLISSAFVSQFFWSMELTRSFISIRLLFFSVVVGILMGIDHRLNPEDRGSLCWYLIMMVGALMSAIIGLNLLSWIKP